MTRLLVLLLAKPTDFDVYSTPHQTAHGQRVDCKQGFLFASGAKRTLVACFFQTVLQFLAHKINKTYV
jgi:hypothetical protein